MRNTKKHQLALVGLLTLIIFAAAFFLREQSMLSEAEGNHETRLVKNTKMPLIVIDPGHGGTDPGTCQAGILEKDINLAIAQRVAKHITSHKYPVQLTRETDKDFSDNGVFSRKAERQDLGEGQNWQRVQGGKYL
ncbi:hypothetical protein N752_11770 [Desulforamulus aquiferis]|nr:N-acetylmuramoyl-L-alanine amidase [Desulforamulus aquiferis]RYD05033.1 hypothetical protein N752_11770 [Desulforamulus aquiferis]